MTSRFVHRVFLALLCGALVTLAPAWSEEPTQPKSPERTEAEKSEKSDEVKVYTNADLRRPADPPATDAEESSETPAGADAAATEPAKEAASEDDATEAPEANPLDLLKERQAQQAERQRLIQEAELRLAEANTEVSAIEKRIAAIRNPYLAPPKPADDDEEWAGQNNVERLESSKSDLAEARAKVTEIEAELRELRSGS